MIVVRHKGVAHKVPCGKCAFCLQQKRSQWMFRVWYEMRTQEYPGYFVTLTYNERYVRRTKGGRLSLRFKDVQLMCKKIRKHGYYLKYIIVGEYGAQTSRPHYHGLLWTDCPPVEIERFWSVYDESEDSFQRLGQVHFGTLTMESAMYTLKYILQPKVYEDEKHLDYDHRREKTRAQFSRGIGIAYLSSRVYDYHTANYDDPVFTAMVDGKTVALPRYYRLKIFTKYQLQKEASRVKWTNIREFRQRMRDAHKVGIYDYKNYEDALNRERARRIISKTKVGQKL